MKPNYYLLVLTFIVCLFASCDKNRCTDPTAVNYNAKANNSDGTCNYNILYKNIDREYIFLTSIDSIMASNDPISNHIDSILSGDINSSIVSTGRLYMDIDQNEVTDLYFEIIDLNLFNPNALPANFDSLAVRAISPTIEFLDNSTFNYPDACDQHTIIDSNSSWSSNSVVLGTFANAGQFNGKGQKYLGIRIPDGNNYKYGWIRLKCSQHNDTLTIYDYAFHTISNTKIYAAEQGD